MLADLAGSSACDIVGRAKHIYHPDLLGSELCRLGLWGRASHGLGSRDTDTAERPFIGAKLLEPARSRKRDNPDPHEDKAARRC